MYDVQVADAPCSVGPTEGEAVIPGLDGLDGALGAEGADGPPALGFGVPTTSKVMNWVSMLASSPSTGHHQVVVGGVVAPAQGRVRCHGRGHGTAICAPPERVPSNSIPSGPR